MAVTLETPFHDWLVGLRRHFHQYPELAYKEEKTAARIAEELTTLGVRFVTGIGQTGVVAWLEARRPGATVAFRADMDALALYEMNPVPYQSKHPGVMHACGHDGHITIALGVIRYLLETGWPGRGCGRMIFFFQPAEEGGAGARAMLDTGIADKEPIGAIFAGHMHPEKPAGQIGISPEASNASADSIRIRLTGRGGHAAHPHLCIDPIVAGAHLVVQMQSIISRNKSPLDAAVLTIGQFKAGTASNVIPEQAVLQGTLRTLRPEVRRSIVERLQQMVDGIGTAFGVEAGLTVVEGYPMLINDPDLVRFATDEARELLGAHGVHSEPPRMGAEDFAYFLEKWPGVLVRLGCHDPGQGFTHGLHSPHFDFDERALDVGVLLFTRLLTGFLDQRAAARN